MSGVSKRARNESTGLRMKLIAVTSVSTFGICRNKYDNLVKSQNSRISIP
ncbi:hypothetical protein D1AOALGA4SA_7122 [Olavius algarvensis Delta 1 endosymbiont]|nr:hypothetical protein D1AOALGA4SA_7122 [Olavius algarvensis Delta 1 endosymbiont]